VRREEKVRQKVEKFKILINSSFKDLELFKELFKDDKLGIRQKNPPIHKVIESFESR
jgi:hypothetical protein